MDIHRALYNYVQRIVCEVDGIKVLLVDKETSFLLEHQVFLVDLIDGRKEREELRHCKCICFVRPTGAVVDCIVDELRNPIYAEYHLYFTCFLKNLYIERLAEADEFELVRQVAEYYADCVVLSHTSFSLNLWGCIGEQLGGWAPKALSRTLEGLSAALLALKRRPVIRFCSKSTMASVLANDLKGIMCDHHRQQFDLRQQDVQPVLLIYDRRKDGVSCLLNQWTFQAMLHELFSPEGITNNRIKFTLDDGQAMEMALSVDQDPFYAENIHSNYGALTENLNTTTRKHEQNTKGKRGLTDREGDMLNMRRHINEFPEWQRQNELLSNHVALVSALQRQIIDRKMHEISEREQDMVTQTDVSAALSMFETMMNDFDNSDNAVRLAVLYACQFCRRPGFSIHTLLEVCRRHLVDAALVEFAINYAIIDQEYSSSPTSSIMPQPAAQADGNLAQVVTDGTVYTQHVSPIVKTIDKLLRGKLSATEYPIVQTTRSLQASPTDRPTDVIVFVVNGGSFQEECQLQRLVKRQYPNVKLVYGCTAFHNSKTFLNEIDRMHQYLQAI